MEQEKIVYSKNWSPIIIILIILALTFFILTLIFKPTSEELLTWSSIFTFIALVFVITYALFGISKIEFHPDKIIVQFVLYGTKLIPNENIDKIIVKYQPRSGEIPELTYFTFCFNNELPLKYFHKRKFSFNSNLFNDTAKGKEVHKVLSFLKQHYTDKLEIIGLES